MVNIINKIVKSQTAPTQTNVLWDDGENLKIYRNGVWENTNSTEIKEGSIPLSALSSEIQDKINSHNLFVYPEDFMEEEYDEPDEDGFLGKVKQVYVTDILENRYNKINVSGILGDINITDNFIIITANQEAFQTEEKQESHFEIIIRIQDCKFTNQAYLNKSPFVTSIFSTDAADINGDIRYNFVKSVTDEEIYLPEENKQLFKKNMGSFADWNALKGEAGYIENKACGEIMYSWDRDIWNESRPLSVDDLNNHSINFDSLNAFNEGYRIGFRYVVPLTEEMSEIIDVIHDTNRHAVYVNDDGYVNYNKYSIIGDMEPGDKRYIYNDADYDSYDEDPFGIQIYFYKEDTSYYLEISMSYLNSEHEPTELEEYIKKINFAVFYNLKGVKLKQINYDLLPSDVVLKKTENLYQYQKNKILANLGIDPVVWKYLCNPYILKNGETIPDELISEYNSDNFKYINKGMYLIHVDSFNINDKEWDMEGEISMHIPIYMTEPTGEILYGVFTFTDTEGKLVTATVNVYCVNGKVQINSYQN